MLKTAGNISCWCVQSNGSSYELTFSDKVAFPHVCRLLSVQCFQNILLSGLGELLLQTDEIVGFRGDDGKSRVRFRCLGTRQDGQQKQREQNGR